jgi:hypothetical protein
MEHYEALTLALNQIESAFHASIEQVREQAKPKEAAKCEDYEEPWSMPSTNARMDAASGEVIDLFGPRNFRLRSRAVACVNALAGIPDPAAYVARTKKLVEHCKANKFRIDDRILSWLANPERIEWLRELESLVADA